MIDRRPSCGPFSRLLRALLLGSVFLAPTLVRSQDFTTSFEFTDTSGSFTRGSFPVEVTFENGEAKSIGSFSLYRTGFNSWMVDAGVVGTIRFQTPAIRVALWLRDQNAGIGSVLTAFDAQGGMVGTFAGTTAFQNVELTGTAPIAQITLANNGSSGYAVIDDFEFDALPQPPLADPIPTPIPTAAVSVSAEPVAEGLVAPVWGTHAGDGTARLFVADQAGQVIEIDLETGAQRVFLDVGSRLVPLGIGGPGTFDERGLLGLAFHPEYVQNGRLYTYTSEPVSGPADFTVPAQLPFDHQSVVTEWQVPAPADPDAVVDLGSARELLRIDEPQFNHNAGALAFGPDGYLYISVGDGGNRDDVGNGHSPGGNGQDTGNVLGSVLRIDVDGSNAMNGAYGIPPENPLIGAEGVDEIFAWGLRNPFRISFDTLDGTLYIADVGQGDIEEINRGAIGANYGWPRLEGSFFFVGNGSESFVTAVDPGVPAGLVDPIAQYDHDEGIAIVGGFVARGDAAPALRGRYVFGDFGSFGGAAGRVFALDESDTIAELDLGGLLAERSVLGFGQDAAGDVYVLANETGTPFADPGGSPTGVVLRLVPEPGLAALNATALASLAGLGTAARTRRRRRR